MLSNVDFDERSMHRALELARETVGLASPNPQVGCVLVRPATADAGPVVLGEGAHRYDQRDHAEIVALKQAVANGCDPRGATAFVTLEPCSHHGRTGPCADALIAAGVARCVVATADPNPLVSGQGLARMRAAGIAITLGVGEAEARDLNLPFACFIQHRRPLVTLKAAISVDGYLAPPPATRQSAATHWLTGPQSREEVHRLRHASDALLTGIGTVLADNPVLTDRSGLPRRRPLLRVVLDSQLRTPIESQLIQGAAKRDRQEQKDLLLLCAETASHSSESRLLAASADNITIARLPAGPSGRINLPALLSFLGERQILSVLLESGSALNGSFLHEDLVDCAVLFFSETALGEGSVPFATGGLSPYLLEHRLRQKRTVAMGVDRMVTGLLHDPGPVATASPVDHLG